MQHGHALTAEGAVVVVVPMVTEGAVVATVAVVAVVATVAANPGAAEESSGDIKNRLVV